MHGDAAGVEHSKEDFAKAGVGRDPLVTRIIGCAIEVHRILGPGLLESTYHRCLAHEFRLNAIQFREHVPVPVEYKGIRIRCGYTLDFICEERVSLEIKSVERVIPLNRAQLHTYEKHMRVDIGYIIYFNVPRLVDGLQRVTRWKPVAQLAF